MFEITSEGKVHSESELEDSEAQESMEDEAEEGEMENEELGEGENEESEKESEKEDIPKLDDSTLKRIVERDSPELNSLLAEFNESMDTLVNKLKPVVEKVQGTIDKTA